MPCGGSATTPSAGCDGLDLISCSESDSCYWHADISACTGDSKVTCFDFEDEATCENTQGCYWWEEFMECFDCEQPGPGDCPAQTTAAPKDTGASCKTYDPNTCPTQRCQVSYDVAFDRETCGPVVCVTMEEEECTAHEALSCTWDASLSLCYNSTNGPPCGFFQDQAKCSAQPFCEWNVNNTVCAGHDTGLQCWQYPLETCPTMRCFADVLDGVCRTELCIDFTDLGYCNASGCDWVDNGVCLSNVTTPCGSYQTAPECGLRHGRCAWDISSASCGERSCNSFIDNEALCSHLGCNWDGSKCFSDASPDAACNTLSPNDCPSDRCTLQRNEQGGFYCSRFCCPDVAGKDACVAAGCTFDPDIDDCKNGTSTECKLLTAW